MMESTGRFTSELKELRVKSYDRCQSCGIQLPKTVAAYAGYASDGSPRYVGECCLSQIQELASHIYWWWEADKRVEPTTRLWRYMDLSKFLDMLETKSLFFARVDNLGDPFEGASGMLEREGEWNAFYLEYFKKAIINPPSGYPVPDVSVAQEEAHKLLQQMKKGVELDRRNSFVSCWHSNTGESEALWRLYCPPGSPGVAIETTAERLTKSLGKPDFEVGRVQYIDFKKSYAGIHDRVFWKRSSLAHEAEVRAVYKNDFSQESKGVARSVDIESLCVSVVPTPFSEPWFGTLIESVIKRYGFNLKVTRSELLSQPFY